MSHKWIKYKRDYIEIEYYDGMNLNRRKHSMPYTINKVFINKQLYQLQYGYLRNRKHVCINHFLIKEIDVLPRNAKKYMYSINGREFQ